MKYMGSKNRHAGELLKIILKDKKSYQCYVEPFVGGANVIDKVTGDGRKIASDLNRYLIALHCKLRDGWLPPESVSIELYEDMKNNLDKYDEWLIGYVAFQLSFGSMWFGSYRRDNTGERDYSREAYNNIVKQAPNLKGIEFYNCSYSDLDIPDNSVIYCDPPYENTAEYKANEESFDHAAFWQWCRDMVNSGHDGVPGR